VSPAGVLARSCHRVSVHCCDEASGAPRASAKRVVRVDVACMRVGVEVYVSHITSFTAVLHSLRLYLACSSRGEECSNGDRQAHPSKFPSLSLSTNHHLPLCSLQFIHGRWTISELMYARISWGRLFVLLARRFYIRSCIQFPLLDPFILFLLLVQHLIYSLEFIACYILF
jgi:hypothetical protein